MSQPVEAVCGSALYLGFMLRSSPIVCLLDTCYTLCRILHFYFEPSQDNGNQAIDEKRRTASGTPAPFPDQVPTMGRRESGRRRHYWKVTANKAYRVFAFVLLVIQSVRFFAN